MEVFTDKILEPLFFFVERLNGVKQKIEHHPEEDCLVHSMQVLNLAFRESYDTDLILAAMLHDIGKFENSLGHDKIAIEWLDELVSTKTLWLIENHMRFWTYIKGEMKREKKRQSIIDHPWLPELIQLCRWDHMGRVGGVKVIFDKEKIKTKLNKASEKHFKKGD